MYSCYNDSRRANHMKLQQLRYLSEVARRGLNVSEAAEALHTSQPGVSKQIRALEDELGIQVFVRHGKRLVEITEPGKAVIAIAERILAEAHNLRRAGEEFANEKLGTLTIATTHTQARYSLPRSVTAFKRRYPKVQLVIHQGNPTQICEQVLAGEADLCVATEAIALYPDLISMPVFCLKKKKSRYPYNGTNSVVYVYPSVLGANTESVFHGSRQFHGGECVVVTVQPV